MRMNGQLEVAQFENLSSDPALLPDGRFWYNTTSHLLKVVQNGAAVDLLVKMRVSGSRASPTAITAGGGVTALNARLQLHFIEGSGGAVIVTANPQISAGSVVGDIMILVFRNTTNTVTLAHGTGLSLNGDIVGEEDDVLMLLWDGTNWSELSRRR
jgi:hypothetical protein